MKEWGKGIYCFFILKFVELFDVLIYLQVLLHFRIIIFVINRHSLGREMEGECTPKQGEGHS